MQLRLHLVTTLSFLFGCGQVPPSGSDAALDTVPVDTGVDSSDQPVDGASTLQGQELFGKLVGLWTGNATGTPLGSFPIKNMDFRPVDNTMLFGRVDLDANNSLWFGFVVERRLGQKVLVFRSGGLFTGLERNTRASLVEIANGSYRFCAVDGGCDYLSATISFPSADDLELRVTVRGQPHEIWNAHRVEARTMPDAFPANTDLTGDEDFPPMPSATIRLSWDSPLGVDTDVWAILSTTSCIPSGACNFSRWIRGRALAGSTELEVAMPQLHPGSYFVLGLVDAESNLASTRVPSRGDLVSVPSPQVTVTSAARIDVRCNYNLP